MEHPAARRFGHPKLPGGGVAFRIRGSLTSQGCLVTFVFVLFAGMWAKGALRLVEQARDRSLDTTGAGVLALFVPCLVILWFLGPNGLVFATRLEIADGRMRVKRGFRWRTYDLCEVLSVERAVVESTGRRGPSTPSAHACRLRLRNGTEIDLGHGSSLDDLDWLGTTQTPLLGFKETTGQP